MCCSETIYSLLFTEITELQLFFNYNYNAVLSHAVWLSSTYVCFSDQAMAVNVNFSMF